MRRAATFVLVVLTILVAGCGGSNESTPAEEPSFSEPTTATPESAAPAIVGRWEQVHSCPQLVKALGRAGLRPVAPAMVGDYFPDQSPKQLAQKPDVCKGARPQRHGHFFTEEGLFGSLDQDDNQVDDGTYEVVNAHLFRIGKATFRYRIADGMTLMLHPVITASDRRRALARPFAFSTAGWQVSVAYDGLPWKRVDCAGWC